MRYLLLLSLWIFNGCFYTSTLNSSKVLSPGKIAMGVNLSGNYASKSKKVMLSDLSLQSRVGVINRVDVGVGITGLPPLGIPAIIYSYNYDIKLQFLKTPIEASLQLGGYRGSSMAIDYGSNWHGRTFRITTGKDDLYCGIGVNIASKSAGGFNIITDNYSDEIVLFSNIGKEFGDKFKFTPEIGIMHFQGNVYSIFGMSIKYSTGG